jgi:hypothetical protein
MKCYRSSGRAVALTRQDFIAQGGEGQVYGKGDLIYKIYFDPGRVIPAGKIEELQRLRSPNILVPRERVFTRSHDPIGITMDWVRPTIPLCRLFTSVFRHRRGVEMQQTLTLVENMRRAIDWIHRCGCLMADGNEFNYLVSDNDLVTPYLIDVDSYQTPGYPATAVMVTVKDPHAAAFSAASDWYALGVVACQLFVGIHPFKGRHPDYGKHELERRMQDNMSIFNPRVSLPPAARDPAGIPSRYRQWFVDLFERGGRRPAPDTGGAVVPVAPAAVVPLTTKRLRFRKLKTFDAPVTLYRIVDGVAIVRAGRHIWVGPRRVSPPPDAEVVLTHRSQQPLVASRSNGRLQVTTAAGQRVQMAPLTAEGILVVDNTLYVQSRNQLLEAAFLETARGPVMSIRNRWPLLPNATVMYDGLLVQDVMGVPYLMIPMPRGRKRPVAVSR